jgi:Ion transport protein
MLVKIYNSIGAIGNFSILLFLFLFTYTLFGLELYANKIKFDNSGNPDLENG